MSFKDNLRNVKPYVAGEQPKIDHLIKLNTNENPYSPGNKVKEAILNFNENTLNLYPNPDASELVSKLSSLHNINEENIFIGNGSDEVLALTFLTCFNSDKPILFPDITYSFYPVYCDLYKIPFTQIPLKEDFTIDINDYKKENGGIIFPNPNAPTSLLLSLSKIEGLIAYNKDSVIVIDEAYIDFGGESVLPLINKYENLLVTRTFSKYRSLAGIRLGVAYGSQTLISKLYDVKNSFNSYPIDRLAQVIGCASIDDENYIRDNGNKIIKTRDHVSKELKTLGFHVLESKANFIFVSHEHIKAEVLFKKLRERNIVVRYFNAPRIDNYLRITIGDDNQMKKFMKAIYEILESE